MATTNCSLLRDSLIRQLNDAIEVSEVSGQCVFSLPIRSLDDRNTEVFIEKCLGNSYRVHDAGITTSHLFAQGIHLTENKIALFDDVAQRLGASYSGGTFEVACGESGIEQAILAISQIAAIASIEIATHRPVIEEERPKSRVEHALVEWKPPYIKQINKYLTVKGRKAKHQYDFVTFPHEPRFNTVAIQVLSPSHSPQAQAERYGFIVVDTEQVAPYETWKRFAIITKAEQWGNNSLQLVADLAHITIPLVSGEENRIPEFVPQIMRDLSEAA